MAIELSADATNARVNAVLDRIDQGSTNPNGQLVVLQGATELAALDLANPAYASAVNGSADLSSKASGVVTTAGTPDGFEVRDRDGGLVFSGSVSATGGSGDLQLDSTTFEINDKVEVTSLPYAAVGTSAGEGGLVATQATLSGTGTVFSTVAGSTGGLTAAQAVLSGSGSVTPATKTINATGALTAAAATLVGVGSINPSQGTGESLPTTLSVSDSSTGTGRPIAVAMPLPEGSLGTAEELVVEDSAGNPITTQWNTLASWRTDDSQLHGMLCFEVDGADTFTVKRGSATTGTAISKTDITTAGFDAVITAVIAGTSYSLSAADLLSGTVTPAMDYTHYAGPISSEYVVGGPIRQGGTGTEHGHLRAYFYVRAFNAGSRVFVTTVLENTGAFNAISDVTADSIDISVGGASQYSKSTSFTLLADCRYPKRFWWGGDPGLFTAHDMAYVQKTRLVPGYRPIALSSTMLDGWAQSTDWNQRNLLSNATLSSGGAKPELATYDRYTAAYLVSGDERAFNAMRTAQDEYSWMTRDLAGSLTKPRDENTGLPVDIAVVDRISLVWGTSGTSGAFEATRDGTGPTTTDLAHQPSIGYVPYLLTGEASYLEDMQFSGINPWLNERPGGYVGTVPTRRWGAGGQVRAIAWGFREVVNAGTLTPDSHPLRQTMADAVTNAVNEMNSRGKPLDSTGTLGVWLTGPGIGVAIIYSASDTPNPNDVGTGGNDGVGYAPWQDDWLTWAIGIAYQRGWRPELDTNGLWTWKAQATVKRFGTDAGGGDFCWDKGSQFAMGIQDDSDGPLYDSWTQIFSKNFPNTSTCEASGGEFSSGDRNPTDFAAQISGALTVAVDTGISGAAAGWDLYDARATPDWSTGFDTAPEWALLPIAEKSTTVSGSGGLAASTAQLSGSGSVISSTVSGTGGLAASNAQLSGEGTVTTPPKTVSGDGTLVATAATLSGSGSVAASSDVAYADDLVVFESRALSGSFAPSDGIVSGADLLASLPAPLNDWASAENDPAVGGPANVWITWSGGIGDGSRRLLYVTGGGHDDSANNGLYRYDFRGTSLPTGWSLMPNTLSETTAAQDAPLYTDGLPGSIHTYDGLAFDEGRNRFYRSGGARYSQGFGDTYAGWYDVDTATWVTEPADYHEELIPESVLDQATGKWLYLGRNQFDGRFLRPDGTASAQFTAWDNSTGTSGYNVLVQDTSRSRVFVFGNGNTQYLDVDWVNETVSEVQYTATGATAILSRSAVIAAYDTVEDAFWLYGTKGTDMNTIFKMDAATFDITEHTITGDVPATHTEDAYAQYKRFVWMDDLGYLGLAPKYDGPAYIVRVR